MENTVETARSLFESLTQYTILESSFLSSNYLHTNYVITANTSEQFVVRLPNYATSTFDHFKDEYRITRQTQKYKFDIPCLYFDVEYGYKITKYIITTDFLEKNSSPALLEKVANALCEFHNIPYNLECFYNPFEKLKEMKKSLAHLKISDDDEKVIAEAEIIFKKYPFVYSHNYLNKNNILIRDENVYFINYQNFGKNIAFYDIASLLDNLEKKTKNEVVAFLKYYYKDKYKDVIYRDFVKFRGIASILCKCWETLNQQYNNQIISQ